MAQSEVAPEEAVTQGDGGRQVRTPREESAQSWLDILRRTMSEASDDRMLLVAAGVTFYTLLAIFPGLTAMISLVGLFADSAAVSGQLERLSQFLPGGAGQIIGDQVTRLVAQKSSSLGLGVLFGIGVSFWSASAGMKALFDALNVVYDQKEERGFIKLSAFALVFTLGAIVFLLLALGAVVALPIALRFVGLDGSTKLLMQLLRWPLLFIVVTVALTIFYRFGASRAPKNWRWISLGSALAAILWVVGSLLFSWYVQNFGSFNETYGSLGAVIGFMTWIWLSTTIFLLGAELNSQIERSKPKAAAAAPLSDA